MRKESRSVPVLALGWDTLNSGTSPSLRPPHLTPRTPRRTQTKITQAENRDSLWYFYTRQKKEWHKGEAGGSWIVALRWEGPR